MTELNKFRTYQVADITGGGSLSDAISRIGSNEQELVLGPGTYVIDSDLTIPANVALVMKMGAILQITTGKTLTINGPFEAGLYQVFDCVGTGVAVFDTSSITDIYPEWWGAIGDGNVSNSSINTLALNFAGAQTTGKMIISGHYKISNQIRSNISIIGINNSISKIDASDADPSTWTIDSFYPTHKVIVLLEGAGRELLPELSVDANSMDSSITLVSSPSVAKNDLLLLYNPVNFSYSGHRFVYRAGEMVKVGGVTGSVIELQSRLFDNYRINNYTLLSVDTIANFNQGDTIYDLADPTIKATIKFVIDYNSYTLGKFFYLSDTETKPFTVGHSVSNGLGTAVISAISTDKIEIYKINTLKVDISDISIIGMSDILYSIDNLMMRYCIDGVVKNCDLSGYTYFGLEMQSCFNMFCKDNTSYSSDTPLVINMYPIAITNSQNIHVDGGVYYSKSWTGATIDGNTGAVTRSITFTNGMFSGSFSSIGMHGNSENIIINNCTLSSQITIAGNNIIITNNNINATRQSFILTELSGISILIQGNNVIQKAGADGNLYAYPLIQGKFLHNMAVYGGEFMICNNNFRWIQNGPLSGAFPLDISISGSPVGESVNISITGNNIDTVGIESVALRISASYDELSDSYYRGSIVIKNNNFDCGIRITANSIDLLDISNNNIKNPYRYGIYINSPLTKFINIRGNTITGIIPSGVTLDFGMYVQSKDLSKMIESISITDNSIIDSSLTDNVFVNCASNIDLSRNKIIKSSSSGNCYNRSANARKIIIDNNYFEKNKFFGYNETASAHASNYYTKAPKRGFWNIGDRAYTQTPLPANPPGWFCSNRVDSTTTSTHSAGTSVINIVSSTNMLAADSIGIEIYKTSLATARIEKLEDEINIELSNLPDIYESRSIGITITNIGTLATSIHWTEIKTFLNSNTIQIKDAIPTGYKVATGATLYEVITHWTTINNVPTGTSIELTTPIPVSYSSKSGAEVYTHRWASCANLI